MLLYFIYLLIICHLYNWDIILYRLITAMFSNCLQLFWLFCCLLKIITGDSLSIILRRLSFVNSPMTISGWSTANHGWREIKWRIFTCCCSLMFKKGSMFNGHWPSRTWQAPEVKLATLTSRFGTSEQVASFVFCLLCFHNARGAK